VRTHQIRVSEGRDRAAEIRRDLFVFPEVIDVFVTSQPDALVVVFVGRPRPGEWVRALRWLGYDIPSRQQATRPPAEVPAPQATRGRQSVPARSRRPGRPLLRPLVG
jgi:hypothetical protein